MSTWSHSFISRFAKCRYISFSSVTPCAHQLIRRHKPIENVLVRGCRSIILQNRPLLGQGWEKFPPQRLEINWKLRDEDSTMARTGTLDTGGDPPQAGSGTGPTPWPHIDSGPCYASYLTLSTKHLPVLCFWICRIYSAKNVSIFSFNGWCCGQGRCCIEITTSFYVLFVRRE